ncbi:MAG: DUF1698 domain-containing protein [Leptospiraceae bacterium]|nr:DUF1698 domain-containing protein [Leptospiraceae bacterium]
MRLDSDQFSQALAACRELAGRSWFIQNGVIHIPTRLDNRTVSTPLAGLSKDARHYLHQAFQTLRPWRKGPFQIDHLAIQANWRSDVKFRRLRRILSELFSESETPTGSNCLQGLRVCDIGANNGYFLFALSDLAPQRLIGLDPTLEFYQAFRLLQALAQLWSVEFLPAGYQALRHFPLYFDLHICMGLYYHLTDPLHLLRSLHASLRKGGRLILEGLCLPPTDDDQSALALVPRGRYLGMRGVWQVPDQQVLINWLTRSGFGRIQVHEWISPVDCIPEQTRTHWGDLPGLAEGLDPHRPGLTMEGYPAAGRIWISAVRG